ncbi:MAG: TIGR02281 family clan AA aspartic protease [Methylophilaceae bacterium]|nr:TIGR02281 family clan AA aspartic protease [Methylophilaceae bacterium]
MPLRNLIKCLLVLANLLTQNCAWAEMRVNVVGLFNGKAVLVINGSKPITLSVGQSSAEGVRLLSADSNKATLEIEGKRKELGMGSAFTAAASPTSAAGSVVLYANAAGHYFSEGQINGATLKFLVDTGATAIAMNSGDAKYAGIDYKKGKKIQMQTASGIVDAYYVVINTLKLGGIILHQVDAVVLEGGSPQIVLLGMTALNRMEMKREGLVLTLTKRY